MIYESWLGARGETALPLIIRTGASMRTCVYDRANVPGGMSDPAPAPRTSVDIANDLRAALRQARIEPPYALVGDSFGAMNAIVFAGQYPGDVVALALVEPLAPDALAAMLRALPDPAPDEPADIERVRRRLTSLLTSNSEAIDIPASERQVLRAARLADLPVIIVTANSPLRDWLPCDESTTAALEKVWRGQQRFYDGLSANTRAIRVDAGHDILGDDADTVSAALLDWVANTGVRVVDTR
ncbi:MAG: alpha/beta fold hydrolase [Thermoflexales bacterium]